MDVQQVEAHKWINGKAVDKACAFVFKQKPLLPKHQERQGFQQKAHSDPDNRLAVWSAYHNHGSQHLHVEK